MSENNFLDQTGFIYIACVEKQLPIFLPVEMPIAYTKTWGKGKIFYCSIGHHMKDFENLDVVRLICQGIKWAVKS